MGDERSVAEALDEELQYLFDLEHRSKQRLLHLEDTSAANGLKRRDMVKTMNAIAHVLKIAHGVVHLAAALLDMSLKHGWLFDEHLQSLAVFLLAVKYEGVEHHAGKVSLSQFVKYWTLQHRFLFGGNAVLISLQELRHAEAELALMLAPLNLATADKFLRVFLAKHVLDTEARKVAVFLNDTVMVNNVLGVALPSMQAAASVLASLAIVKLPLMDEAQLDAQYGAPETRSLLHGCVQELLQVYREEQLDPDISAEVDKMLENMLYTDETMEDAMDLRVGSIVPLRSPGLSPLFFFDSPLWRMEPTMNDTMNDTLHDTMNDTKHTMN